jgi:hypothetical protein
VNEITIALTEESIEKRTALLGVEADKGHPGLKQTLQILEKNTHKGHRFTVQSIRSSEFPAFQR